MSTYIQMGVYGICAVILIVDGFLTLLRRSNMFYKKDGLSPLPLGLLLLGAGGTVIMLAARILFRNAWTDKVMWLFIFFSMAMMAWLIIDTERHK